MPPETRRRAKAINFGIVYGISAFGLANQLGIGQGEAGAYIKTYFERFPGIRDLHGPRPRRWCASRAMSPPSSAAGSTSRRSTPSRGAERQFGERAAINAPIQGAAADIIRRAMIRMPAALRDAGLSDPHAAAGARRTGVRGPRGRGRPRHGRDPQGDGDRAAARRRSSPSPSTWKPRRPPTGMRRTRLRRHRSPIRAAAGMRHSRRSFGSGPATGPGVRSGFPSRRTGNRTVRPDRSGCSRALP